MTKVPSKMYLIEGADVLGSSAMFAEAIHSCADTLNQCILLFGKLKSSKKADDDHPYGYSSLQNVTALISGCAVFCLGSGLSYYHGIRLDDYPTGYCDFPFYILVTA